LGNVLRHAYDQVDPARIWEVIITDLTPMAEASEAALLRLEGPETLGATARRRAYDFRTGRRIPDIRAAFEALMPAEPFQLGRVPVLFHAGGQRAALEAVAAELARPEPGGCSTRLHDAADRARGERLLADRGEGREGIRVNLRCQPDAPENRAFGNLGGLQPAGECSDRTNLGAATGQGNQHGGGLRPFASGQRELVAAIRALQIGAKDGRHSDRRSAPAKPTSSKARSRKPRSSSGIGASNFRNTVRFAARFFRGLAAPLRMPAMVSEPSAVSVEERRPAARCRNRIAALRSWIGKVGFRGNS